MNVHLFGVVSSPGVANFGLMTTAREGGKVFGDQAREFLENEFYVDDGPTSFASPEEAITTVPKEDSAKDLIDLDLRYDTLPIQRSLGTYWCIESDMFGFQIQLKDKP